MAGKCMQQFGQESDNSSYCELCVCVCVCVYTYRVFKGVFRGDSLQLFQGANGGIPLLILAISHQQFVVFTVGFRGTQTHMLL